VTTFSLRNLATFKIITGKSRINMMTATAAP
jgi:hypothetical protein